jgi:hypothetical protein
VDWRLLEVVQGKQLAHLEEEQMLDAVKHKIVFFWLTHGFLRRIAKRYPEYFEKVFINDITDNRNCRKIMKLRYMGDTQMKFEAIAIEMKTDPRNVFKYHKKVIDTIISGS